MRLHRLSLTHVKGVAHREVVFPERGVVILEGANEIGKTSLIEALDLLIDYKDSSRDRRVLAMRPVGLDEASIIEVEMTSGPYRFRYRKQWFRQPGTTLTVTAPRAEHLVGTAAHERVQQILAQTADLTLWKALRLMQATALEPADLGGSTALAAALDAAAGRRPDQDGDGDCLVDAVEGLVSSYFTPRAGAQTGEYRAARDRLAAAEAQVDRTEAALAEVREDVARHAEVATELTTSEAELLVAEAALTEAQTVWQRVEVLSDDVDDARRGVEAADRELRQARARQQERDRIRRDVTVARAQLDRLVDLADELTGEVGPQQDRVSELATLVATAEQHAEQARVRCDLAQADQAHTRDVADLAVLEDRLNRIAQLDCAIPDASGRDGPERRVDTTTLEAIETAARDVDLARAAQQAGSGSVVVAGMSGRREIRLDGQPRRPAKGEIIDRALTDTVELVVPGVITVTIRPPAGAEQRAEAVRRAEAALAAVLAEVGLADLAEARTAHEAHRQAVVIAREHNQRRADLLGPDRLEELHRRAELLRRRCEAYRSSRAQVRAGAGSGEEQGTTAADAAAEVAVATAEYERARARLTESTRELAAAQADLTRSQLELARAGALRDSLTEQVRAQGDRLTAARADESDEALAAAVVEQDRQVAAARVELAAVTQRLAEADPDAARERLSAAQRALDTARRARQELHDERVGIEARLERAGRDGRQEAHEAAVSEAERARRGYRAVERRAVATRLLHDTLQRHRAEARRAYVEPFRSAVGRVGQQVYGPDFAVEIDDSLAVRARVLNGQRLDFEALSTGAKEQLAIITRLACASLVEADAGVPVVIDDALGYSDPERLRQVGAAFRVIGPEAQLVLLTCTPGRYSAIEDAEVIRLL